MINIRADYEDIFKTTLWNHLKTVKGEQVQFLDKIDLYKHTSISEIVNDSITYDLSPDYVFILHQWVKRILDIELTKNDLTPFKEENYYSYLFTQSGLDVKEIEDDKIISILYFAGNEDKIKVFLKEKGALNNESVFENDGSTINTSEVEIIEAELTKGKDCKSSGKTHSQKGKRKPRKTHTGKSDELKKLKGKESEILVLKKFEEKYGKGREHVRWVSGYSDTIDRNDNLQHDIEYKNEENIWVHVEVKTLSNNSFILTAPEKEHALSVAQKYEFALVDGNKIYRIYKPFKFNVGESFESNDSFQATPKDYTIKFNLSKIEK